MNKLSHVTPSGQTSMVDVAHKPITMRIAWACGWVVFSPETCQLIRTHGSPKGPILETARLAGIMAAKKTGQLIPLCHPLPLDDIEIAFEWEQERLYIESMVKAYGRTGVEMEALTAVTVTALTIYDMCKAVDKTIQLGPFRLLKKIGGKSGVVEIEPPRLLHNDESGEDS